MSYERPDRIIRRYEYHVLQRVNVHFLRDGPPDGLWLMYATHLMTIIQLIERLLISIYNSLIHGGAWRDPTQTAENFSDPVSRILHSPPYNTTTLYPHISTIASISYRLSPHPNHPQNLQTTKGSERNDAKHPEHIQDVLRALSCLRDQHGLRDNYILTGHSCGATLAFQTVMHGLRDPSIPQPLAILGTEGIYDIRLLRDTHKDISAYQDFSEGAFGKDESVWDAVSPAFENAVQWGWERGRLAVLAQSPEDSLVDAGQVEAMKAALGVWEADSNRKAVVLPLKGEHDEPWREGVEFARAIAFTIEELQRMGIV